MAVNAEVLVDMVRCTGHGMCALLLPERVELDAWGFPVVDGAPVSGRLARRARHAARACPRRALVVHERVDPLARPG